MMDYFSVIDSFPRFDTLRENFRLLKAYHKNDTAYLRQSYNQLISSLRTWHDLDTTTSCEKPTPMRLLDYKEAYRFSYSAAFCDTLITMTVGKGESEFVAEVMLYARDSLKNKCVTVKRFEKKLDKQAWDKLLKGIRYADFWGLQPANDERGFDGSSLYVFGFKKRINAFQGRQKVIYRWGAERTAIGTVFKDMMDVTGTSVSCFHFNHPE